MEVLWRWADTRKRLTMPFHAFFYFFFDSRYQSIA